ncbi:MAG: DUF4405 domain-containing protein [Arcobacteraceae bacterium]|nr:DUF4405 domain-containing protein [Arcobacteraceae bacterium]
MLRKTTSFILLYSFIIMVLSGAMLFISPFGRLSMMIKWEMLGLGKMEYQALHLIFMLVFTLAGILHTYLNYRAIVHYWKNKSKKIVIFTKEFSLATAAVAGLFYATVSHEPLTEKFVKMNKSFNDYWVEDFKKKRMEQMIVMRRDN